VNFTFVACIIKYSYLPPKVPRYLTFLAPPSPHEQPLVSPIRLNSVQRQEYRRYWMEVLRSAEMAFCGNTITIFLLKGARKWYRKPINLFSFSAKFIAGLLELFLFFVYLYLVHSIMELFNDARRIWEASAPKKKWIKGAESVFAHYSFYSLLGCCCYIRKNAHTAHV
jgi:hypothetical protein